MAIGTTLGFSPTASVAYSNPNTTTLEEILDEEQVSWLSKSDNQSLRQIFKYIPYSEFCYNIIDDSVTYRR